MRGGVGRVRVVTGGGRRGGIRGCLVGGDLAVFQGECGGVGLGWVAEFEAFRYGSIGLH